MRMLIVTHWRPDWSARTFYEAFAKQPAVRLSVIAPAAYRGSADAPSGYEVAYLPLIDDRDYNRGFRLPALARALLRAKPDVIFCLFEAFGGATLQLGFLRRLGIAAAPVIVYAFENLLPRSPRRARLVWRPAWRGIDAAAAASEGAGEVLRRLGFSATGRIQLVPFGVPLASFVPRERSALRRELRLSGEFLAGYVGRLVPGKGVDLLIKALPATHRSVKLLIIGDGTERERLADLARALDLGARVSFVGAVPQEAVAHYLAALDALVVPSVSTPTWKEQFGRVLVEAMACGTAVIGSASGAIPEVIGSAGLVVPENDPEALAAAISTLATDAPLTQALGEAGTQRANATFGLDRMAASIVRLASELV